MIRSISRMSVLALVLLLPLVAACGAPGDGDGPSADGSSPEPRPSSEAPDGDEPSECGESVSGDAVSYQPCPGDDPADGGPKPVEPSPGQLDVHAVPWDRAEPRGARVRVFFWSGVEPCYVLDRVEVDETPRRVTITLYEGRTATEDDVACIEVAVRKVTEVPLEEPLGDRRIVDGARRPKS